MKLSEYLKKNNMTSKEYFEMQGRRSKGKTTLTDYRRNQKASLTKTIGFDTLESDLNSLGTTIEGIYDAWQTEETMRNTRSSIESMYNRLTSYQDYRKTYGITDGEKDITDLVNNYKTTLDNWDSLASHYGEYKSADEYKKAEKAQSDAKKRKSQMANADLKVVQSEITDLEKTLKKANDYNSKVNGYKTSEDAAQRYSGRNGYVYNSDNENAKKLKSAQSELNNYLKSVGYSSVDDIKKALKDKQSFLEEAKVIQEDKKYSSQAFTGNGELGYEKYQQDEQAKKDEAKKEEADTPWYVKMFAYMGTSPDTTLPGQEIANVINDKRKDDSYKKPNEKWTHEAKLEFGARYLDSPQKAYEYAAKYNNALAEKEKNANAEKVSKSSTDGFWGTVGNWMGARLTAPLGLVDYLDDVTDMAAGRDTIVQEGYLTPFEYSQTVGESQASALNEWSGTLNENIPVLGGKGIGDAYSLVNSMVDSKVSATTMGTVGTLLNYFGQAAASGVDDAMSRGASGKQALLFGTAQGFAEGIPEMISADKFLKLGKKADIGFLGKVRKQAREEGTEELVTALLSNAADNAIMRDKSQFNIDVKNLMLQGLTEEEAKEKVWLDKAEGIAFDALGGYLSGGFGSVGKVARVTNIERKTGAKIRDNERVNETLELASLTPEESDAYNLYTEYSKKGVNAENIKDVQLGRLYNSAYYNAQDTLESGKTTDEQKVTAVKTLQRLSEVSSKNTDAIRKKELNVGESTTVTSTGNSANIEGIKVDNDKTTLVTNEGEISIDDMTLSDKDADLVVRAESITKEYGEEMGNLFLSQYDGTTDVDKYATSFNLSMEYAKHNFTQDMMIENRGVLSTSQVQAIHNATVHQQYVERDNKIKSITEKQGKSQFVHGNFDDSIIDYDGKTTDGSKVNYKDLSTQQRRAVKFLQLFSKATGVNIKLIKSSVELGKHKGKNGSYDPKTNTIEIDVYAGRIDAKSVEDSILPTLSHEVTHWMKHKASAIYDSIREDVMKTLAKGNKYNLTESELVQLEMDRIKKNHPEQNVTPEDAIDELVARACEDMLKNSNTARKLLAKMSKTEQTDFIAKVKETFDNLMQWVNDLLTLYKSNSEEAEILRNYKEMLKKISKQWDSMLETAIESNQALQKEGIIAEQLVNGISEDGTTIVGENNIQMSERTYAEGGREFLEKWLSEQEGLTDEDKKDILFQTDTIANLMKDIRENNELPEYARWAEMDVVKDENGDKVLSVIVKNGDYAMNIDFSQVCKKRVALNAVLNAMVQSGDLNAYTLTETDVADLNAIIKKHEFEIACALCFVDSKRYRVGGWAESFCEGADKKKNGKMVHQYGFNEMVRSLVPKGSKIQIDEFNFTNRNIVGQPTSNLLSEIDDSELDFTLIDEILEIEYNEGKKPTDLYAYAKAIKDNKNLRKILNPAEIISSIGLDAIRLESPDLYRLINRHQGTARPKFAHDSVAYTNDVLRASNFTKEKAKMVGGVRCQSFSDFMANMVFDYVQFISELAAKELTSHSYTKEPLFVRLFGMTGMKINMSLVPKAVQMTPEQEKYFAILNDPKANKRSAEYQKAKRDYAKLTEYAGLDENGNYIWEDETFPYDIAMELVDDPKYSANCGTIAVGISDKHILKLLADDKISMVIPYHKSGLNHIVAKMRNIELYVDYTKTQNTRFANGKKLEKVPNFDFYGDLYGTDGKEGTHNPKQTAENYLKWCDEHNYIPKFEKSIKSRKFRDNPNYYKLLVDFRVYDTDGTYREQQPVKPIYPENEEFKDLILNGVVGKDGKVYGGLKQQQGTSDKLDAESKQIVDEFRNKLKEKYGKDVLATKNSDRDYVETGSKAVMTNARIDYLIEDSGAGSRVDYANYWITSISPTDFLNMTLTKDLQNRSEFDKYPSEWNDESTVDTYDYIGELKKNMRQTPYLAIDISTGKVDGHEGRHRMRALEKKGITSVEIRVEFRDEDGRIIKYSPDGKKLQVKDALIIKNQYDTKQTATLNNIIPLNNDYREQILTNYGENVASNEDMRYSDRDNVSAYEKLGETDKLIKDNEKLKADVERLKERLRIERQVTNGNFFNENQLNAVAGHIRNIADSNYDKKELVHFLNAIYQYIAHSPDLNWQDLYSQCYDLADKVLDKSRPITETNPYYKDILDDIRKTKISVNEQQIQNAKYRLGNKWRNSFFNKISISENGISLDRQWQEWSSMYPNIFDADLSDADQLVELLDTYDSVRQASETVVEYDKEERTRWLAREIYNQYWNVSPIRTTADRYDKQIKKLNFEHRKAMQELRESYDEKLDEQRFVDDVYYGRKIREMKKTMDEKLAEQKRIDKQKAIEFYQKIKEYHKADIIEVKLKSKERMDAYKENAEKKTKIQSITSNALTLNKWLTTNSKDYHINETLKPVVINLLQAIDFSSKQMLNRNIPTNKDISLYKALQDVKNMLSSANNETALSDLTEMYGIDMDEEITKMLDSSFDTLTSLGDNGYILNQMSLDDLNTLNKVVKTIKQVVTKLNKFHIANHYKGVVNLSQNTIGFFDRLGQAKVYDSESKKGKLAKLINWNNLNPFYAFKKFGDGGKVMFEALQDGQDKLAYHIKEIIDFTKEAYTSKEVRDWSKDVRDIKVHDMVTNKDVTVHITVAQAMSLYCSLKREQAKGHILGDGIRITDISVKKGKVISQAEGIKLGISDIAALTGILDSRQKLVADKLQNFMNTICTDWGNEISMARFGYKAFGEPNYFPISSDKNNLAVDDAKEESNSLFRLLNMSFTKSTVKGANNKVEIKNIFDVFAQHTSDMAKYNAFALPILDFYKWFNYTEKGMVNGEKRTVASLKASMEKAFGKEAKEYVTNFLKDINGQYDVSRDTLGKGFFKNAKIAAVGMNLRVVLLQPTSYVRASAVINNKYLTKALLHKPKISKAEQYCGMALWKSLGYYDTNIQRGITEQIKHDETWKDKAVEVSMKGAEIADKLTWGYLWNACELEIRETRKDLEVGSAEFYETIGKRLREVIYATQVVDSTMTRSQLMRSQSFYDKMLTAFASEPTLAYNMLYDAIESAHLEKRANGKVSKESLKKMARVMVAYTMTNVVAAWVESGFDAFRDEDDEEMDIAEFMKLYLTNLAYDMSITAKLPYVKEVVSVLQGFTSSRTDTQWMQSLGYALKGWFKVFAGDGNPVSAIKNSLRSMAYLTGLPFYNAYRDIMATLNKLDILTAEELEEMFEDFF